MIDPNTLDRSRLTQLKALADRGVNLQTGDFTSHQEKTFAFVNLFVKFMLEDIDKELTEKERLAERRKPAAPSRSDDHPTGRGAYRSFDSP